MVHTSLRSICFRIPFLLLVLAALTVPAAAAGKLTIKLGTLAPRGTSYHKSLLAMGEKWRQASAGDVKLVVFPDGTQGGESDMVGLMKTGSLDAGMLTAVGLSEIEKAVTALQNMPMVFRNYEEVDYIGEKLKPMLEKRLLDKGFVVLFWGDSGWVRFFSKKPVVHPADLRQAKLFVWTGNAEEIDLWKEGGFHPVPLDSVNILPSLQTGLITATPAPPFFALATQLDVQAPHMIELNWAPLVGAAVVNRSKWDRLTPELRTQLLAAAQQAGRDIKTSSRAESAQAVEAMKKRGLKVQAVSPELESEWRRETEKFYPRIRGLSVPADLFDEVFRLLKEYRAAKGAAK